MPMTNGALRVVSAVCLWACTAPSIDTESTPDALRSSPALTVKTPNLRQTDPVKVYPGQSGEKHLVLPPGGLTRQPSFSATHRVTVSTPYYLTGPQQSRPPEGEFAPSTRVTLISRQGGHAKVIHENGVTAYVSVSSLTPISTQTP